MSKIRDGQVVYAKFDKGFQTVYMTAHDQIARVGYTFCSPEEEAQVKWRLLEDGYLPCDHVNDKPAVGEHEKLCYEFKRLDDKIEKRYFLLPENEALPADVPAPNKYSVRRILSEVRSLGKYDAFRALIEGGKLDWDFVGANYLQDGDTDFELMKGAIVTYKVMTADELAALLPKCLWAAG